MKKYLAALVLSAVTALNMALTFKSYDYSKAPKVVVERQTIIEKQLEVIVDIKRNDLEKQTALHLIRSTVRVIVPSGFGSGVVVFSGQYKDTKKDSHFYTYVLTCAHVVGDAKKANIRRFDYLDDREISEEIESSGKVIYSDAEADIAIIELKSNRKFNNVVGFVTPDDYAKMVLDDPVFVVGSPLGYPPFITRGNVSCYGIPDHYGMPGGHIMVSAPAMFGNSGCGAFTVEGKLLGMVRLIGAIGDGSVYSHTDFIIPVWTIDTWLRERAFGFIVGDQNSTIDAMHSARAREEALRRAKKFVAVPR